MNSRKQFDRAVDFFLSPWVLVFGIIFIASVFYISSVSSAKNQEIIDNLSKMANEQPELGDDEIEIVAKEKVNVSPDDDEFIGRSDAPITMIEFSDFQCPFCRKFWRDTFPEIKTTYIDTGKVKFVYRDFPTEGHEASIPSAQSAECAGDQNKFWQMHDKIFIEQDEQGFGTVRFSTDDLKKWAKETGLDAKKFNACLDSDKYLEEVEKDESDGASLGVFATPSTFVNGLKITGSQPFETFKKVIDEELARINN